MKAIDRLTEQERKNAIACKVNNEVKSLNTDINDADKVEPLDITIRDGRRIYQRGI